jgi:hypothetical protein
MFRGGPVSSYGTGIAAPLVPGYKGGGQIGGGIIYGKPMPDGRYGFAESRMSGNKTGSNILKAALNRSTYFDPGALPGFRSVKKAMPIVDVNAGQDGGQQLGDTDYLVEKGYVSDVEEPVKDMSMAELIDYQIGEKADVYQTGKSGHVDDKPREVKSTADLTEDELLDLRTEQATAATGAMDMVSTRPEVKKTESKSELELENERLRKLNAELMGGGDDPSNLDSSDLESMIKRYEKILGGEKAFGQDVSDMLLGFAGATGDTVMEKFQDFAATEAKKGPSRTEKIKQAAGMLGIKGEQAKEIAALQATGKLYAPGITQKTAMYIKSLPKGSSEHATALAQIKWPPTLDRKIAEDQMSGPVTLDDVDVYAGVYIDNYKGRLVEGAIDGVYLNAGDSSLVWVDDKGEVIRTKQLDIK